jgi:hypothetical protein
LYGLETRVDLYTAEMILEPSSFDPASCIKEDKMNCGDRS